MRHIILFLICTMGVTYSSSACSCALIESFCEHTIKAMDWDPEHLVIVRGVVVNTIKVDGYRRDLVINIKESFHNPRRLQKVRIRDGNGADCGRNLDEYGKGDELIFLTSAYEDNEIIGQFSICAPAPLRVDGSHVSGHITDDQNQKMSLNKFRRLSCIPESDHISFYPNPTNDVLRVVVPEISDTSNVELYFFNAIGQMIFSYTPNAEEKNQAEWTVDVRNWPSGTYYLKIVGAGNHVSVSPLAVVH